MQIRHDALESHLSGASCPSTRCGRGSPDRPGGRRRHPRRGPGRRLQPSARSTPSPARTSTGAACSRRPGAQPVRRSAAGRDPDPVGQARQGRLRGPAALLRGGHRRRRPRRHHAGAAAASRRHAAEERLVRGARSCRRQRPRPARRARGDAGVDRRSAGGAGPARRLGRAGAAHPRLLRRPTEGNLLAAHQRSRSSACSTRPASWPSRRSRRRCSTSPYEVFTLGEAVLAGQTARAAAHARGPAGRGRSRGPVHWTLAEDSAASARQGRAGVRQAMRWRCAGPRLGARSVSSSVRWRC